jgi:hypothetical protein
MQRADCRLVLHTNGSDIALKNITPAEAQILIAMHTDNAGQNPLKELKIHEGEAASVDKAAEYFDTEVTDNDGKIVNRVGDLKKKATYRLRTDAEEKGRLLTKYAKKFVEAQYPGANPSLPKTFAEVKSVLKENEAPTKAVWTDEVVVKTTSAPTPTPTPAK